MLKYILFFLLCFNLYALEVSLTGAKENFQKYSTLHLKDSDSFLCQETTNDYDVVTQIICAFSKQPANKFKKIQNDFFEISSQIKNETFFLIITPYQKIKLYPIVFNLSSEDEIYQANTSMSKHWMAVGYREELPYIKNDKAPEVSINFPVLFANDKLPFVGGLDIEGKPVHIKRVGDVTEYLQLKNYYKEKKYEESLELIDEVLQEYPNTLFRSEFLFYKIKVYAKLKNYETLIDVAKVYLRNYSSDENIAEVLSLTAKAYDMVGMSIDADYFFDRLFSEHEKSPYAKWGYIYKGEMLEASGASSKALAFYRKALEETADIDIAVNAAYRLARYKVSYSNPQEASEYIMKIINSKPSFFIEEMQSSLETMYTFVDENDYETATVIAKALLDEMKKDNYEYEFLLKNRALWLCKTDNKEEALAALNEYIETFKYGTYEQEVRVAKDALFFDTVDANLTSKLNQYNELIDTYNGDTIGDRARYEKAKLLLENRMYSDVLGLKESLLVLDKETFADIEKIIQDAAVGMMKRALQNKECQEVIDLSSQYNILLSSEWDDGLYQCYMKGANYTLAKNIAANHLDSKEIPQRKKWLYRYIKVDFSTGNYSEVIEAGNELISLIEEDKESEYKDIYRILFDTYQRLEESTKMLEAIVAIERVYGVNYKDIDRYVGVMAVGSQRKDDNIVIKYGREVMKIQNSSNSFAQSPFVEFTLYQAYLNRENLNEALEILQSLDRVELTPNQRARQKYLLGTIYDKLWRDAEAKQAYLEAIKSDPSSAWAQLAKDAKDI